MRLMALDVGERRIGIAVSNTGFFAMPHTVLYRKSKREDFARLQQLVTELNIERIIVGLPYSLSGPERIGPQARRIKRYTEALMKSVTVPFEYFDESYSTVDAKIYQQEFPKKNKMPVDAVAAAIILQNYLDSQ